MPSWSTLRSRLLARKRQPRRRVIQGMMSDLADAEPSF
jgi:hypothetical protein